MSQDGYATWEAQVALYELLKNDPLLQNGMLQWGRDHSIAEILPPL